MCAKVCGCSVKRSSACLPLRAFICMQQRPARFTHHCLPIEQSAWATNILQLSKPCSLLGLQLQQLSCCQCSALFAVLPNGVSTGLDIGLSNFSLSLITLSFYTMCKSTVPVFLLCFAFIWKIEK